MPNNDVIIDTSVWHVRHLVAYSLENHYELIMNR